MTRKLKALGLAFVAVLAFGALSATAASAASFHSEAEHTIISGAQPTGTEDVFTVKAGTVKCKQASYTGTTSSMTTGEVTVIPAYNECTAFGFVNTKIDVPGGNVEAGPNGGCDYRFTAANGGTEDLHIVCGANEFITVTAFNCHVHIGSQTLDGILYDNAGEGSGRDMTVTAKITGIKYTQTSKTFPGCTNGTFEDGTYNGSATVSGATTTGGAAGIWWTA